MCSICLDDENKNKMVETQCHHFFHKECLDVWLKTDTKSSCPDCRQVIKLTVEPIHRFSCYINLSEREINVNAYRMMMHDAMIRYST